MSRGFVVVGHEAPTDPEFPLEGLASEAGRMDLLARSLIAGLLLSHDIRTDAAVTLVLGDGLALRFDGADLRGLHPDERSAAALIRAALDDAGDVVGASETEVRPGVHVSRRGFEAVVRDAAEDGTLVALQADGEPAGETTPPADPTFVLSDHRPFDDDEQAILAAVADRTVSLGPERLHADAAVAVANNWADTDGFRRYRPG